MVRLLTRAARVRLLVRAVLLAFLVGCAEGPRPVTVVTPPPVQTPPVASSAVAAPPAPPPAPPVDPAADGDRLAIAKQVCPAAIKHDKGQVLVGCRTCPPFD